MVKLLSALIAVIVLALGGYFGFDLYLQHRAERDIEAA
ncbi:MAG: hypothetical protein JWR73_2359, partial [Tardiphaga sp.]|nr:hypothetical protein [Tardiphaga sp.]